MTTIDLIDPQPPKRKPEWLKVRLPSGESYEHGSRIRAIVVHVAKGFRGPQIG